MPWRTDFIERLMINGGNLTKSLIECENDALDHIVESDFDTHQNVSQEKYFP